MKEKCLAALVLALFVGSLAMIEPLRAEDAPGVRVLAAGSLRTAIGEIAAAFAYADKNFKVATGFRPLGRSQRTYREGARLPTVRELS